MKKIIKIIFLLIFIILLFNTSRAEATSGSTVFIGQPITLDSYDNIEITQISEEINEETSEIKSTQIFTNGKWDGPVFQHFPAMSKKEK